jgi:hypothetical protein
MDSRLSNLLDVVTEIVQCDKDFVSMEDKTNFFVTKYPLLANTYPTIFSKACEPHFDLAKFSWMLNMANNVRDNQISQHDASVQVGEKLVDEHVKPLLS